MDLTNDSPVTSPEHKRSRPAVLRAGAGRSGAGAPGSSGAGAAGSSGAGSRRQQLTPAAPTPALLPGSSAPTTAPVAGRRSAAGGGSSSGAPAGTGIYAGVSGWQAPSHSPSDLRRSYPGGGVYNVSNSDMNAVAELQPQQWAAHIAVPNHGSSVACRGMLRGEPCSNKLRTGQPCFVIVATPKVFVRDRGSDRGSNRYMPGVAPGAVYACSAACACKLQSGFQPAAAAHFRVHSSGSNSSRRPLALSPTVAADSAAVLWLRSWVEQHHLRIQS